MLSFNSVTLLIVSMLCLVTVIGFNRFECLHLILRNKTIKIETIWKSNKPILRA